ncbi:hypothetical protein HZC32_01305 [Candidatus Woesearchaeota archaeon]|nr:hypothetical protein [Candidatus Woesearchaeota archaeon]
MILTFFQAKNYIINKDLYDLCLLARHIEGKPSCFNKAYYLEAKTKIDKE